MRPDVEGFLGKAERRLEAARELHRDGMYEDAVSRSYYAVLNGARATLASRDVFPKTHGGTLSQFADTFVRGEALPRELESKFSRLGEMRAKVEDSPALEASEEDSEWSVEFAQDFLRRMRRLLES